MASIIVLGKTEAIHYLMSSKGRNVDAVVSIGGPSETIPSVIASKKHIRLQFDDVEFQEPTSWPRYGMLYPPTKSDIELLVTSAPDLLKGHGVVLVHCAAGVSRSSACAYILKCIQNGPGHEAECLFEIEEQRPQISPNIRIIELGQELLGEDYDLIGGYKQWKKGI